MLGEMWRHLGPAARRPYVDQSKANSAVYHLTHPEVAKPKRIVPCKKRGRGKPNLKRNIENEVKTLKTGRWQLDTVKTHDDIVKRWTQVCPDEFGIPAFPIDFEGLEEYIVRLMAVD
jgi:hypothetical protein